MKRFSLTFLIMGLLLTLGTPLVIAGGELVAHWTFDKGTGKIAEDVSGNGHDGELVGDAKWVDGHVGKALEFNGVNNEFVVPDVDDLDGMSAMTIAAWANPFAKGDSVYPRILSKGHEHSWTFLIDVNAGNKLRFIVSFDDGTKIDLTAPADLTSMFNQYHHYAVVWDGKEVVFTSMVKKAIEQRRPVALESIQTNPFVLETARVDGIFAASLTTFGSLKKH